MFQNNPLYRFCYIYDTYIYEYITPFKSILIFPFFLIISAPETLDELHQMRDSYPFSTLSYFVPHVQIKDQI